MIICKFLDAKDIDNFVRALNHTKYISHALLRVYHDYISCSDARDQLEPILKGYC